MAHNDFKRHIWLIALLYNTGGASFAEIDLQQNERQCLACWHKYGKVEL